MAPHCLVAPEGLPPVEIRPIPPAEMVRLLLTREALELEARLSLETGAPLMEEEALALPLVAPQRPELLAP